MKVILSRKGFDSAAGGYANPILPDGTLLSLPIPDRTTDIRYDDLKYKDKSYYDIMTELCGTHLKEDGKPSKLNIETTAHLDPDIRTEVLSRGEEWRGLFGQAGSAQSHLLNQDVGVGDLFLFFGWFRKTIEKDGKLKFDPQDKKGRHIIYGYMQVDQIIKGDKKENFEPWMMRHPHTLDIRLTRNYNTLYIARQTLSFDDNRKGFGILDYNERNVLTKPGHNRTEWQLPKSLKGIYISYHTEKSWKDGFFKSAARGQEFVIKDSDDAFDWVQKLLMRERTTKEIMFYSKPEQWGLRGDPFLWDELSDYFVECEFDAYNDFELRLIEAFGTLTGCSIFSSDTIYIKRFDQGGMSSGMIDPIYWKNVLIPLLLSRY